MKLLQELVAHIKPYEELKELYLMQRHSGKNTALFRSLLLRVHRHKLPHLLLCMLELFEHANEAERQWFEQEFALR
jgi:hypothetical protein